LETLASAPQPVDPAVYGAPTVSNGWGSLLMSTANVAGFNAFVLPPFSSGWNDPVDSGSMTFNGVSPPPTSTVWSLYGTKQSATITVPQGSGASEDAAGQCTLQVTTEVRMSFEQPVVLLYTTVQNVGTSSCNVDFTLDMQVRPLACQQWRAAFSATPPSYSDTLQTPTRYYSRADACPSWHYPTHSSPCCWNWFAPMPNATSAASFRYTTATGAGGLTGVTITDPLSPAVGAWAVQAPYAQGIRVQGSVMSWSGGVSPPGYATISSVYVVTNTTAGDAWAAATAVSNNFENAWALAQLAWQEVFSSAFTSDNNYFSGNLPVLSVGNPSDPMFPLERIYYHSVQSLLGNLRTNLPVPMSGAPCSEPPIPNASPAPASLAPTPGGVRVSSPRLAAFLSDVCGVSHVWLAGSAPSPNGWNIYVTGGGDNSTSNVFLWDNR